MTYKLMITENSHYMDDGEGSLHGEYSSAEEARAAAKAVVEADLNELFVDGMSADDLYRQYTTFGRDVFVVPADADSKFSAWDYAKVRAASIAYVPETTETTQIASGKYRVVIIDLTRLDAVGKDLPYQEYDTAESAIAGAKVIIDDDIARLFENGMTGDQLFTKYTGFGRRPTIVPEKAAGEFSPRDYARRRCFELCGEALPGVSGLSEWFRVHFHDTAISIDVNAPGGTPWQAAIAWESIVRICFKTGDFLESDEIYIFTGERAESYLVPVSAGGGIELWNEIVRRGLFDAEVAIQAAATSGELFCWPPPEGTRQK